MLLKDKVAIVTGANRGIGFSIARTFLQNGAKVIACIRSLEAQQEDLQTKLDPDGVHNLQLVYLDLSKEQVIKSAIKVIMTTNHKIDILVNNAGIASGGLFQMTTMNELRRLFEINFFGQLLLTQGIVRLMQRHKEGSIINISSTAACIADPGTLGYGSSKAAFVRASQSMATEFGNSGIRVNAIAPGLTRTDMFDQMTPAAREKLINSSSLKRAAEPQDIANAALFLASNLSTFVTGQILRVDGGIF
ncbi:SDR family NAD(P)-dependent oxidoreductase [Polynucleobacter sp. HIN7]|uniref:SDR family NAD(P)-dependent oxidoreductase n=1 Tax=Polynucleobacter sp. HIN7 TaxID=3047866 RepID=UPI00257363E8|nr:SDR family oxidoreductase [Polynucleobacter sp. HIN7]BEI36597.1 3-oxoacyl-[acyl-carrier-protein] reductase [Polynucleobacter sp. HIN7]